MTANIIKFPHSVSRRAHSRKPRRSKNGTPEERARQAASENVRELVVAQNRAVAAPSCSDFLRELRVYLYHEIDSGKTWYRALEDLEESCLRAEKARAP